MLERLFRAIRQTVTRFTISVDQKIPELRRAELRRRWASGHLRMWGIRIMLEWAREVVHRLLEGRDESLENGKTPGERSYNGQRPSPDHTDAFVRFLQDYKAHIDEEFEEGADVRQPQPRRSGPPDSPSAPTPK
jgi:hypothetical protein